MLNAVKVGCSNDALKWWKKHILQVSKFGCIARFAPVFSKSQKGIVRLIESSKALVSS